MSEMTVTNLTVDLLQDSAAVSLHKQPKEHVPGKSGSTGIHINVPISTPGNQPESQLKKIAVEAAKKALHEALEVLDKHHV